MPKVGMEPVRRKQLIEATIKVVAEVGLQSATISLISKEAGLSSGIISHYFGGKQGLIEATVRYLLDALRLTEIPRSPEERLMHIVDVNFSDVQRGSSATKTWLSFWGQSMHDPELSRLQEVNKRRLSSNLRFSFKQLMSADEAREAAEMTAALIDGFWLRCALSRVDVQRFETAKLRCKRFIQMTIANQSRQH